MPLKSKKLKFRTCSRCGTHFHGTKYAKICYHCDKGKNKSGKSKLTDAQIRTIIEKGLADLDQRGVVFDRDI